MSDNSDGVGGSHDSGLKRLFHVILDKMSVGGKCLNEAKTSK